MRYIPLLFPFMSFATVVPSLGFETGFGFDAISNNDQLSVGFSEYKYKRIWTYDVGLNGRLDINNAYIIGQGIYRTLITAPHLCTALNGDVASRTELTREDGFDLAIRTGYSLNYDGFVFSPEVGFAYQNIRLNYNQRLGVGAPFIGFQFDWNFVRHWRFNSYFNYSFLGFRREDVANNDTVSSTTRITMGSFSGPAGGFAFGYSYVAKWHILFGFNAKYIESTRAIWPINPTASGANTTWLRLNTHVEITYNF